MRTMAEVQADIDANEATSKALLDPLKLEKKALSDRALDERWKKEESQAIIDRKAYALELAKETIPPEELKAMGFDLYTGHGYQFDVVTEPMAIIRLGDLCWAHYNRVDGSVFLTSNHVHMHRLTKVFLPRIFRKAEDLAAFIKATHG